MKVFSFTDNFTLGVSRRLPAGGVGGLDFTSSSSFCRKLAPGGTLTLGTAHKLVDGDVAMLPYMSLPGKIALFRLWRREWSEEEVTSLGCVEGEMVTWWWEDWETRDCAPLPEDNLTCEWSFYEVNLLFAIFWSDGSHTELHAAKQIAQEWLGAALPGSIYLNKVSLFEVHSPGTEEHFVSANSTAYWVPVYDSFECLIHATAVPSLDVAAAQSLIHQHLKKRYRPNKRLTLLASADSIRTTAVEDFAAATAAPTGVVTEPPPPSSSTAVTSVTSDGHITSTASTSTSVTSDGQTTTTGSTLTSVTSDVHSTSRASTLTSVTSDEQTTSRASTSTVTSATSTVTSATSTFTTRAANLSGTSVYLQKSCFDQKL
ncbi:uncharacterized protein LOC142885648 [Nelusetta ayraudi]|uniref:uncharacterized protein LOC142885648 n=1 Tax=Nelusetta ayraudi TaxID=303726 RepID=UPI003F72995B